jgi:hypothetical protein
MMPGMFRFVYARQPGESFETLAGDGFVGVETGGDTGGDTGVYGPAGMTRVGLRLAGDLSEAALGAIAADAGYVAAGPAFGPAPKFGRAAHDVLERRPGLTLMVEAGGPYVTPHALWTLLEAVHHPRARIALNLDTATADGQSPAVVVPTLNLRIGLVRVATPGPVILEYARRLAGIGFEGYVVCDPPAGADRPAAARELAASFRSVFPAKPAKKPAPAKPTPKA